MNLKSILMSVPFCLFLMCQGDQKSLIQPEAIGAPLADTMTPGEEEMPEADTSGIDTLLYNQLLSHTVHNKPTAKWPVKTVYPLKGAILPFNRIIAYYGNLYSAGMGILGALPESEMVNKLLDEVKSWEAADSLIPAIPALHYIAVTAQRLPGSGHKYRLRMPFGQIDKVMEMAKKIDALVILDIQVGHSTLESEIPKLRQYLMMPNVHLGIDPEYSMKGGEIPSRAIGTFDAADINYASAYLAQLVREYDLPPKVLIVHRFTKEMITNYKNILMCAEVQIVINMDGFGFPAKKINTYKYSVAAEPVQFTGFKVFYKNDTAHPKWPSVMKPDDILKLYPKPVYIQYQ